MYDQVSVVALGDLVEIYLVFGIGPDVAVGVGDYVRSLSRSLERAPYGVEQLVVRVVGADFELIED